MGSQGSRTFQPLFGRTWQSLFSMGKASLGEPQCCAGVLGGARSGWLGHIWENPWRGACDLPHGPPLPAPTLRVHLVLRAPSPPRTAYLALLPQGFSWASSHSLHTAATE